MRKPCCAFEIVFETDYGAEPIDPGRLDNAVAALLLSLPDLESGEELPPGGGDSRDCDRTPPGGP
jgi:hypothetical protein